MTLSREDVINVATLARLELSDEEVGLFTEQLGSILGYIEKLSEVDIEGVEPFINAAADGNVFREDTVRPSLPNESALQNSARTGGGFFKVPQVT